MSRPQLESRLSYINLTLQTLRFITTKYTSQHQHILKAAHLVNSKHIHMVYWWVYILCDSSVKCILRLIICSKSLCPENDPVRLSAATGVQQSAGIAPNSESAWTLLTMCGEFNSGPLSLPSFQQDQQLVNMCKKNYVYISYFTIKKICHIFTLKQKMDYFIVEFIYYMTLLSRTTN